MESSYKEARKKDAECQGGHIFELKNNRNIIDHTQGKDYVFISYSSKDWNDVLYKKVYDLCTKKGLRVYFDTKFDEGDESWLTQFKKNMNSKYCKAVLVFVSSNYRTSYATLMELMASRETNTSEPKPVLPIVMGSSECDSYENTGLGTQRFADASTNNLWLKELELFNELFGNIVYDNTNSSISDKETAKIKYKFSRVDKLIAYKEALEWEAVKDNNDYWKLQSISTNDVDAKKKYWESLSREQKNESGTIYLNKKNNAYLIDSILSNIDKNNIDGVNRDITEAVYDKLNYLNLGSVFDPELIISSENNKKMDQPGTIINDNQKSIISIKEEIGSQAQKDRVHYITNDSIAEEKKTIEVSLDSSKSLTKTEVIGNTVKNKMKEIPSVHESNVSDSANVVTNSNEQESNKFVLNEKTTLIELEKICIETHLCSLIKKIRESKGAQPVDYFMASLLRGCDEKLADSKGNIIRQAAYKYCYGAISDSSSNQYTWTSNARKWVNEKERLSKYFGKDGEFKSSGLLYDYSDVFKNLADDETIGGVLERYKHCEKGFITRDNSKIFEIWELIKGLSCRDNNTKKDQSDINMVNENKITCSVKEERRVQNQDLNVRSVNENKGAPIVNVSNKVIGGKFFLSEETTLKEFEELCEKIDFCYELRSARNKMSFGGKGIFDFFMAALLRGCDATIYDKKSGIVRKSAYYYNKYAVCQNPDDSKTSDIPYPWTWTSNCRKALRKEDVPDSFYNANGNIASGPLGENNSIFEALDSAETIGNVLDRFKNGEKGFATKSNDQIFEAWNLIKGITNTDQDSKFGLGGLVD